MLFEKRTLIEWAKIKEKQFERGYTSAEFSLLRNYFDHRLRNDLIRILRRLDLAQYAHFPSSPKKFCKRVE